MAIRLPSGWEYWRLTELLGEGSFGAVYRATRYFGGRTVESAIKVIRIPSSEMEAIASIRELGSEKAAKSYYLDLARSFMDEIQAMNTLKGITNIVSVEDCGLVQNAAGIGWTIFIRMELLTPFPDWAQTHPMSEADVIRLGLDLCTALDYCEKAGIVHRDIKPSNIFVSPMGNFKLGDFGVARRLDRTSGIYSSKGTFPYMAPEVFHGQPYDHRADIYSLGLVLHRLTNRNREPFVDLDKQIVYTKDREKATAQRMRGEAIPAPVDASPALAKVILRACDPKPARRYATAAEMAADLSAVKQQKSKPRYFKILLGVLIIATLILGGLGVFFALNANRPASSPASPAQSFTEWAAETPVSSPSLTTAPAPTLLMTSPPAAVSAKPTWVPVAIKTPVASPASSLMPTSTPAPKSTATATSTPTPKSTATATPVPKSTTTATPTLTSAPSPAATATAAPTQIPAATNTTVVSPAQQMQENYNQNTQQMNDWYNQRTQQMNDWYNQNTQQMNDWYNQNTQNMQNWYSNP